MRIIIDISAADDPDAHIWLDRLVDKIEDRWHEWDLTSTPDVDAIAATTWISDPGRRGERLRDLLVRAYSASAWNRGPHTRRLRVTAYPDPAATDELAPEPAFRLADEPLVILVENRNSDGAFIKRVVTELDKPLHGVWKREGQPIRFDSVGGAGQMPREIENRMAGLRYRPRLVAVIDSDRKGPGDAESEEAQRLRQVCDEHGLPCWVLAKREAENYLPRVLLAAKPDAGPEHATRVAVWEQLRDDQKDFFDMRHGLPDAPSEIERNLFDDLSDADREILTMGFGPNVHQCWNVRNVQEVGEELRRRGRGDLEHGIALIRREL